jgi:RimJ/RimL family protein N-acetyltransferase
MDPRSYSQTFCLRNGSTITLRAIRSDDAGRLRRAFAGLEARSIYTRFFSAKASLTDAELRAATEIDFARSVALVAVLDDDQETIIAGGRYVRLRGPADVQAEVAFTVEEDYQGLGIAGLILRELAALAHPAGITTFVAEVLPTNSAMMHVFRRSEFPLKSQLEEGVIHIELDLTKRQQVST